MTSDVHSKVSYELEKLFIRLKRLIKNAKILNVMKSYESECEGSLVSSDC